MLILLLMHHQDVLTLLLMHFHHHIFEYDFLELSHISAGKLLQVMLVWLLINVEGFIIVTHT